MNRESNLPPGVTDRMIEEQAGAFDRLPDKITVHEIKFYAEERAPWSGDQVEAEVVRRYNAHQSLVLACRHALRLGTLAQTLTPAETRGALRLALDEAEGRL